MTQPSHQFEYEGTQAAGYEDQRTRDAKWQREDAAFAELLDAAAPAPTTVLDIPVGTGRFLPQYASAGHMVVGADISEDMLAESRAKLEQLDDHHVTLELADITKLPYDDGAFDVTACIRLLNLVDEQVVRAAVAELARVTGGHLIIGLRTYGPLAAPYQWARRAKDRLTHRSTKVTPQRERLVHDLSESHGLTLERKVFIDRGGRRSSEYHFYLFAVRPPGPR